MTRTPVPGFEFTMQMAAMSGLMQSNANSRRRSMRACWVCYVAMLMFFGTASSIADDTVYSRTNKFKIPFQFDRDQLLKIGATEVQLFVSTDRGLGWDLMETVSPDAGKFTFAAQGDGEYWFSVRTLTASGLTYPAGPHEPGLKVIVDTGRPQFKIDLVETESGKVQLSWIADDPNLKVESLKLEFFDSTLEKWETVSVRSMPEGQTSWTVAKAGVVEARGSISDAAGNLADSATQTIVAGADRVTIPQKEQSNPIASQSRTMPEIRSNQPIDSTIEVMPRLTSQKSTESSKSTKAIVIPLVEEESNEKSTSVLPEQMNEFVPNSEDRSKVETATEDDGPVVPPASSFTMPEVDGPNVPVKDSPQVVPPQQVMPNRSQKEAQKVESPRPAAPAEPVLPAEIPRERLGHLVNSNAFQIAYQIEDVGPSGVSKIELYITEDQGLSWFHYGSDNDLLSPMAVKVPRDGDYGFAFRIRNGVGLIATPPQPGNQPEIRVTVDRTPPTARIHEFHRVEGNQNQLQIEWTAEDSELHEYPVALYFATQPTGPWELIEGWTRNSGRVAWTIPSLRQPRYFIRMDVRDAAGNVTTVEADQPFAVDTARPKAKITDVESLRDGISPN